MPGNRFDRDWVGRSRWMTWALAALTHWAPRSDQAIETAVEQRQLQGKYRTSSFLLYLRKECEQRQRSFTSISRNAERSTWAVLFRSSSDQDWPADIKITCCSACSGLLDGALERRRVSWTVIKHAALTAATFVVTDRSSTPMYLDRFVWRCLRGNHGWTNERIRGIRVRCLQGSS